MKIFLASASLDDVRWAMACGLVDGVLVSASHLEADYPGADARSHDQMAPRTVQTQQKAAQGTQDDAVVRHLRRPPESSGRERIARGVSGLQLVSRLRDA